MKKLSEKQIRWIDYYIQTGNATEAARLAGYKGKNHDNIGSENLRKLASEIQERMKSLESKRIAAAKEILEYYTSVMRGEITEEVPILCGKGIQKLVSKGTSVKDRNKAAEELGRRYGLDKPDASENGTRSYADTIIDAYREIEKGD